jgi:hypothetical protein
MLLQCFIVASHQRYRRTRHTRLEPFPDFSLLGIAMLLPRSVQDFRASGPIAIVESNRDAQ